MTDTRKSLDNNHRETLSAIAGDRRAENAEPKPAVATPFDRCVGALRFWRNEDHADNIALSRHEVITLLEGIYALRRAVSSHADMLAALKVMVNAIGNKPVTSVDEAERIALQIIAKAEGRS